MRDPILFMDDPDWDAFIPVLKSTPVKRHLPAHEDCSSLDVDETARHLEAGGTLGREMKSYETRPGQIDMLRALSHAYNSRNHLMVEAGTGVGKSLAYLIPSVMWSYLNDTPVIVSTATRNLQSQLIASDIPRAEKVLEGVVTPSKPFKAAVLKGRTNYLCLHSLDELCHDGYYNLSVPEREAFDKFIPWLEKTEDGDLDTFADDTLRSRLTCSGEDCTGRRCRFFGKCFIQKARARAQSAHLIVANHALVLAEAVAANGSILPAYGRIVFDEAHDLESVATDFFSFELSRHTLTSLLGRVERKGRSRRSPQYRGVLGAITRQLDKGILGKTALASAIRENLTSCRVASAFAANAGDELFDVLRLLFTPDLQRDVIRYRSVSAGGDPERFRRQYSLNGLFADYTDAQWHEDALKRASLKFEDALAKLMNLLVGTGELLESATPDGELPLFADLTQQLNSLAGSFKEYILNSEFVLSGSDPSHVYWAEKTAKTPGAKRIGKRDSWIVKLTAAPLSVADKMNRLFFDIKDSVILCSATLRVGDKFDYMAKRLGVTLADPLRVKAVTAASPFDYFRQSLVLAPDCLPDPASQTAAYVESLAPFLTSLFVASRGRGLVLFTAYDMMNAVAEASRPLFDGHGIRLIVQGEECSREEMVRILKSAGTDRPTVLFGSQSFWEGVDVSGAALSCVVLARLPFPQVREPIVEARSEAITAAGGSSFRDYFVPEAVIKFRQGFGRLVRSKSDTGVVVIADPRIVVKNYGAIFRKSLPASVHSVSSLEETVARTGSFFEGLTQ